MSHPLLTINCVTSGTPALVTWNNQDEDLIYQNDEGHQIIHSLLEGTTATYNSAIAFTFIPVNETGMHTCEAETTYISPDTGGTSTATGTYIQAVLNQCIFIIRTRCDHIAKYKYGG